jgi:hypothetical protein
MERGVGSLPYRRRIQNRGLSHVNKNTTFFQSYATSLGGGSVLGSGGANGRMFASLLIENYVSALIGLSENQCSRVGIVKRDGGCAPYQVAVLIGFEDVEGWNHAFNYVTARGLYYSTARE